MSKAVATPTDQEARAYYEANRAKFMSPESVHLHHILVKSEAEAKEALNRLKKGEKFADLAAQISTCPSKAKGGNLDWLPKGRLVKEIDEIAFSMQPGKPSRPIQSKFGWHVLLLEEKREPVQNTFEQVQEYIVEQLKAEHQQGNYEKLMQGLRKKNNVEIFGAADAAADAAKK
jgi:peptidyl-prolyl cis-trans isomerase C